MLILAQVRYAILILHRLMIREEMAYAGKAMMKMDAIVKNKPLDINMVRNIERPTRDEAEQAVRTLLAWAGDDPDREGLQDTPKRVVKAYEEFFGGYSQDPAQVLSKTFEEIEGYDDIVMLRGIDFNSHCEHHVVPFIGQCHIAYFPTKRIVGLSKLARVVEIYARRLQTQETMTAQIANTIMDELNPKGVAVMVEAVHQCMSLRGIQKPDVATITSQFTGIFKEDFKLQERFLSLVKA